jgi:hypothetical protein
MVQYKQAWLWWYTTNRTWLRWYTTNRPGYVGTLQTGPGYGDTLAIKTTHHTLYVFSFHSPVDVTTLQYLSLCAVLTVGSDTAGWGCLTAAPHQIQIEKKTVYIDTKI